ncbi:hypothetical protein [Pseudonocardia sp. GCM10023141]|uniref:hypothetical protein n=1 Tax=Pseudonocardia sp. GCM10023141 TaxID=3252653 RepID=UPI003609F588
MTSTDGRSVRGADGKDGTSVTVQNGNVVVSGGSGGSEPLEVKTEDLGGSIAKVVVSAEAGRITLVGTDSDTVSVTRRIYRQAAEPQESVSRDGDVLRIAATCPSGGSGGCRIDYEFQVPRSTSVELATASGALDVTGARGAVTAKSISGAIGFHDHGSATTMATSTTGNVTVEAVTRPDLLQVNSTSGNIAISVPGGSPYRLETSTITGRKNLTVASDNGAASVIRTKTVTGNVQVAAS